MEITALPALRDNYIWMLSNPEAGLTLAVDPGDAQPVIEFIEQRHYQLAGVLITHHHWDHTGGIKELFEKFQMPVYGSENQPPAHCQHQLKNDDTLTFEYFPDLELRILEIPGHTSGHIAYTGDNILLSGDTLFSAGCGRVFEGSMQQMLDSLDKLAALPDSTLIYCGHEYTEQNLQFAKEIEPSNSAIDHRLQAVKKLRQNNQPSVPVTLATEKLTNPFLRIDQASVMATICKKFKLSAPSRETIFTHLRQWKDNY